MSERDDGGPAFPQPEVGSDSTGWSGGYAGMSLRDYFAAKAMQALMSDPRWVGGMDKAAEKEGLAFKRALAISCYEMADEMLKARKA